MSRELYYNYAFNFRRITKAGSRETLILPEQYRLTGIAGKTRFPANVVLTVNEKCLFDGPSTALGVSEGGEHFTLAVPVQLAKNDHISLTLTTVKPSRLWNRGQIILAGHLAA